MGHIFVSYSSDDKDIVNQLLQRLKQSNYKVWIDRESIKGGDLWRRQIVEGVESSEAFIIALSQNSIKSDNVRKELDIAVDAKNQIIPVDIESVNIPPEMRYQLAGLQRINFVTDFNNGFSQLLVALSESVAGVDLEKVSEKPKKSRTEEIAKQEIERQERLFREEEEKTFINSIGMKFTLIPEGEFVMGSKECGFWDKLFVKEEPLHNVTIHKPFYLGIYPVTQREWKAIMENNPSYFKGDDLPVESVSWDDVQEFVKKLNEKESTDKYRLPSEAEWEYAARAGTTTRYSFGDNESELDEYAWYAKNSHGKTHPVGQKKSNPWGLYDIHGNVLEWVQDSFHRNYDGSPIDGSAWEDGSGADRVFRGGSWLAHAGRCRSASRGSSAAGFRYHDLGFRLLQEM